MKTRSISGVSGAAAATHMASSYVTGGARVRAEAQIVRDVERRFQVLKRARSSPPPPPPPPPPPLAVAVEEARAAAHALPTNAQAIAIKIQAVAPDTAEELALIKAFLNEVEGVFYDEECPKLPEWDIAVPKSCLCVWTTLLGHMHRHHEMRAELQALRDEKVDTYQ